MKGFEYYNPAKIVFGEDSEKSIQKLLQENHVTSLLLVYSGEFVKKLGIHAEITEAAKSLGISLIENGNVVPNPSIDLVRDLVEVGKKEHVDFVLAVGGGSSIDTAKAVALGIPYEGDAWDFFEKGVSPKEVLPIGVISTTASSGSETSNAAIISNGEWKLGFEDDRIIPKFAILNPRFTLNLPLYQTFVGVADVLAHLLERYFSDEKYSDTTDYLIEGAIKVLLLNADRLLEDPQDINARAEIQWLASVAHNNFLDAGRSADWGSHRIEHELSALYDCAHGAGLAVTMPAVFKYVMNHNVMRFAQVAVRVWGCSMDFANPEVTALEGIGKLADFLASIGMPRNFEELGAKEADIPTLVENLCCGNGREGSISGFVTLNKEDCTKI